MFPINIQHNKLKSYMRLSNLIGWGSIVVMLYLFTIFVVVVDSDVTSYRLLIHTTWMLGLLLLVVLSSEWFTKRFVASLAYELDGDTLHVRQGVFTYQHKAISMEKVTDIQLTQGILMRHFGIWNVAVHTAGDGATGAGGFLYAVENPKYVRQTLLAARKGAANGS